MKSDVYYRVQKLPPLDSILSQFHPTPYTYQMHFNTIFPSKPRSHKSFHSIRFSQVSSFHQVLTSFFIPSGSHKFFHSIRFSQVLSFHQVLTSFFIPSGSHKFLHSIRFSQVLSFHRVLGLKFCIYLSPGRGTYPRHLNLLHLITTTILDEDCKGNQRNR
jgi:hypothetical protein